jgi:hypothetical protein
MEIHYISSFIEDEKTLLELVKPDRYQAPPYDYYRTEESLSILVGCVDNNKSRKLCHDVFMKSENLIYLDAGNGEFGGQVVCGIRRKGKTYYKPVGALYPDVLELNATDKFPTELSCAEAAVSAPQSIVANVMASTAIVSYLYSILVLGSIETSSVTFSTKTLNMKPEISQKRKRKAA